MTGRAEVSRLEQRLEAVFERAGAATMDLELQSDMARYLCVLISGYLEQAIIELLLEHTRQRAQPSVLKHVEQRLRRFANAKAQKIFDLVGGFDNDWRVDLESFVVDERRDAVDSVVDLKNTIAHGQSVNVTLSRARRYYEQAKEVIARIAYLSVPV